MGDTHWKGLALVVGTGGIGEAITTGLARQCPDLTVITAGRQGGSLQQLQLDLESDADLARLASDLQQFKQPLRLVFNCSGRLHGPGLIPEKRLSQVSRAALAEQFAINAFAPVLLAKAVEPLLEQPALPFRQPQRKGRQHWRQPQGAGMATAPRKRPRTSSCALSIEWSAMAPATVTLLHPGTTDTELSKPFQSFVPPEKLFSPKRAADQLLTVLLKQTPSDSGAFLAWDGQSIAW